MKDGTPSRLKGMTALTIALTAETPIIIAKGCKARDISKGTRAVVHSVTPMGPDHGHVVKVVLSFHGRTVAFYARHLNRLSDETVRMNDGNPTHSIEVRRA